MYVAKVKNAEFGSRLPTECGDGFRGFQSFCKISPNLRAAAEIIDDVLFAQKTSSYCLQGFAVSKSVKNASLIGLVGAHTAEIGFSCKP